MRKNKLSRQKRIENIEGLLSVLPVLLIILAVNGYPMVVGIAESFTNWDGLFRNKFIGLLNYQNILFGSEFWMLLKNNVVLLLYIPLQMLIGLIVAVLLYEKIAGWKFFRSAYYLPQIVSPLITGYLFAILFGYNGPLNLFFRATGQNFLAIDWLGNGGSALVVIIICLVWINIGWQGMLYLGGMGSIDAAIYDAAEIDGAGYWQKFFKITFPLLGRTTEYSCVMSVMWCFTGLFPIIFSMTNGGPGYETTTIDYMIYLKAFVNGNEMGYASAIGVILMIIVLLATIVEMKVSDKSNEWSE